ncbi:shikimate kinase [Oceanibacterium hippocampi]|uniref:Shikimate kinase n=1 Tax=Oceanibacterium hippocampi TaxID=745714 RepID=A0A1Y5S8R7_9PROT|nr:shikimate kinase [Oceanibacterium hippocampi]SLN32664.1 Shikimate kinase 1 [Oceanibacterium hippocampi]
MSAQEKSDTATAVSPALADRTIVLVGLMGAGKSSIGRRLANRLHLPFADADVEIERAAGLSIPDIFETYGEEHFRDGERRVIARLLDGERKVLATGGGAYMDPESRQRIEERGISIWLRASLEVLVGRCLRRNNRPLLQRGDPATILGELMDKRYPVYAEARLVVDSGDNPHDIVIEDIVTRLAALDPA